MSRFLMSDSMALDDVAPGGNDGGAASVQVPAEEQQLPGEAKVPNFTGEYQRAKRWCWVACATMMARSLGVRAIANGRDLTQCTAFARSFALSTGDLAPELVCGFEHLRLSGECATRDCIRQNRRDTMGVVSTTLRAILPPERTDIRIVRDESHMDALDYEIRRQVSVLGRPVGVLIEPNGGTLRHYILVTGYDRARGEYTLWDPDRAHGGIRHQSLQRWYELGEWVAAVFMTEPEATGAVG